MKYFLGLDIGGSKTHALVADETGLALGFGVGGAGNWQEVGFDGLQSVSHQVIQQALRSAGLRLEQISAAGFGIAGYDWPSQRQAHLDALTPLGFACPLELTNDSIIGLLAGAPQGWGVVVIAGTGNNCRGRDRRGREGRITGEGIQFGEYGGGGEIVFKAIHSVAYAWTQRGPQTSLTGLFIHLAGAESPSDLIEGIDLQRYTPQASWALAVFQAAAAGDAVAQAVIAWSARELGESACAVIRQLGIEKEAFDVVLVGSVFEGGDLYTNPLRETIQKTAPDAHLVRLEAPPVVGGVVLAMQKTGLETGLIHKRLTETSMRIVPVRRDG